jgi:choline dehydrogenase-like flavoprotein
MGSARMGSDPGKSVVDADNQAHDIAGLYVMDGSCFPTASGVNPMISIAAIAHRGATRLAERLA